MDERILDRTKIKSVGWWGLLIPKLFGIPLCVHQDIWETVGYQWRGKIYITNMKKQVSHE